MTGSAKQSLARHRRMDCFASLAMTARQEWNSWPSISRLTFFEMITQSFQRLHGGVEVGPVAIDHVAEKIGVAVHEHPVLGNAFDGPKRFSQRVVLPRREIVAARGVI